MNNSIQEYLDDFAKNIVRMCGNEVAYGKIGIAVNCHNRHDMYQTCISKIREFSPKNSVIVVVDDASSPPIPDSTYRFNENVGIARAKNKALELLYKEGCNHFFLFDDDTWPVSPFWYSEYCESSEPHLMYIFKNFHDGSSLGDCQEVYRDSRKVAYSHPRGCMLYFKRICLDVVGGMDLAFGRWGWEHVDLSDRIFNAGLTSFKYMDVINSGVIYSDDEHHKNANTTIKGTERKNLVARNQELYNERRGSSKFLPFYLKENTFLTCYFTKPGDTQRGPGAWPENPSLLIPLIESVTKVDEVITVLHDCLETEQTRELEANYNVNFEYVDTSINPYFQRWISYRSWLMVNKMKYENVFCVDGTDVLILKPPMWEEIGNSIFVGDENSILDDPGGWMRSRHPGERMNVFLDAVGSRQMLNAGVLGGSLQSVCDFIKEIVNFYTELGQDNHVTDMGAFNYVARTFFNNRLRYGREVTTSFKSEEKNAYSWIKHK